MPADASEELQALSLVRFVRQRTSGSEGQRAAVPRFGSANMLAFVSTSWPPKFQERDAKLDMLGALLPALLPRDAAPLPDCAGAGEADPAGLEPGATESIAGPSPDP